MPAINLHFFKHQRVPTRPLILKIFTGSVVSVTGSSWTLEPLFALSAQVFGGAFAVLFASAFPSEKLLKGQYIFPIPDIVVGCQQTSGPVLSRFWDVGSKREADLGSGPGC